MCGITGFFSLDEERAEKLVKATDSLTHRGPDDRGFYGETLDRSVHRWADRDLPPPLSLGLGFRRLSILDLSRDGAQPMASSDGRHVFLFNGLISNYIELRERTGPSELRSSGDTAVLVEHLARHGVHGIDKLEGMFAIAWWDREERVLRLIRDPAGIKPLYYRLTRRKLVFGSEIRSLDEGDARKLNRPLLATYLSHHYIPGEETLFEGVFRVPPGHLLEFRVEPDASLSLRRHRFSATHGSRIHTTEDEALEKLSDLLPATLARYQRADVKIGLFLSGGIDSSLLASHLGATRPTVYSMGIQWKDGSPNRSDLELSRILSSKNKLERREIIITADVAETLPRVIDALEEPIADPAALSSLLLAEAASKEVKVVLSGQGADELFSGYPVHGIVDTIARIPSLPTQLLAHLHRRPTRWNRLIDSLSLPWPVRFAALRSAWPIHSFSHWLSREAGPQNFPWAWETQFFREFSRDAAIDQALALDAASFLPDDNLTYSDKTSMAFGLEVRVPWLDPSIVRFARSLPPSLKLHRGTTKKILRRLAERNLPPELLTHRKTGFAPPVDLLLRGPLREIGESVFSEKAIKLHGVFGSPLRALWQAHLHKQGNYGMALYNALTLCLWMSRHRLSI